jgi:hypothetical protein
MEIALPNSAFQQTLNITNGIERRQVNLGEAATNQKYQSQQATHFESIKQSFARYAIALRTVSAAYPIEQQLNQRDMGELL